MKKLIALVLVLIMALTALVACGNNASTNTDANADANANTDSSSAGTKTYAFVAKDVQNPYMQKVFDGFKNACDEIGAEALYKGPEAATPEKQIEIINQLVAQGVDGIAIAANDADALQPALTEAMDAGIKVISLDSAVNAASRQTHIQQADPEKIGRL